MKKILMLFLCLALLLTFIGCNNDTDITDKKIECSNFGASITEDSKFCSACGTLVDNKPATVVCPNCDA